MQKLLVILTLTFLFSCGSSKDTSNGNSTSCSVNGTVQDFTGLDGCKFLIVLENGDKLEPAKINDNNFTFQNGQVIKLAYKELKDQMSICMAGKIVEVTCIELISAGKTTPPKSGKPARIPCTETLDPFSIEWMELTARKVDAYQVLRYKYLADGWAYYFKGPNHNMLLDCQGTLLCQASTLEIARCDAKTNGLADETIIWEIE